MEEKFLFRNLKFISKNLRRRNFYLNKCFYKEIFIKKNLIFKKINNLNKNLKIINKKFFYKKLEKIFLNKFKKIYKNYLNIIKKIFINFVFKIPNILNKNTKNSIIKKIFKKKKKNLKFKIKNHIELGKLLGLNFVTGNIISGKGFNVIEKPLSNLYEALTRFMLDIHIKQHNYKNIKVPYIIKKESLINSSQLPKFKNEIFKVISKNNDLKYLIPTSETPLINILKNKLIKTNNLPIKLTSLSPCFRNETKSYGKENKGLIRQNQFDKIELIQITDQKNSNKYLKETIKSIEKILLKLKLKYRIILLSDKDTGISSSKTYDIEVWIPSLNDYCEVSSCSNTNTYQSTRLKTKYKIKNKSFNPHIINASALAVGRVFVAIIENYQKKTGFIKIPKVLKKYIKKKFIK